MATENLFGEDRGPVSNPSSKQVKAVRGKPRLVRANRGQLRLESRSLDELISEDHRARTLWAASGKLDLSEFYAEIQSVEAGPGRPAIDPRILLVLWLYATSEGVGSARHLARLCREHDADRWIAGGHEICHRLLSDFRVHHGDKLDRLLTELLAALMKAGVITLRTVAQDGTRVRASAGAASFRRKKSIEKCLGAARKQVETLKALLDDGDDETTGRRKRAAQERAARQRQESAERALEALKETEESRRRNGKKSEPRASTTDPDARVMKMADGGFRPAYNCQLATDVDSRLILASRVSNSGGDMGQVEPTVDEIRSRLRARPESYLVDGGYAKRESIERLTDDGITVYAPPQHKSRDASKPSRESPQVAAWKTRMRTDEAKAIYKQRAATIETVHGDLKEHRGLSRFRVRGLQRVQSCLLLYALAYDLLRAIAIAPQVLWPEAA